MKKITVKSTDTDDVLELQLSQTLLLLKGKHVSHASVNKLIKLALDRLKTQVKLAKLLGKSEGHISKLKKPESGIRMIVDESAIPLFDYLLEYSSYEIVVDEPLEIKQDRVNNDESAAQRSKVNEANKSKIRERKLNIIWSLFTGLMFAFFAWYMYDSACASFKYNGLRNPFGFFDHDQKARYDELKSVCQSGTEDMCPLNKEYYQWGE